MNCSRIFGPKISSPSQLKFFFSIFVRYPKLSAANCVSSTPISVASGSVSDFVQKSSASSTNSNDFRRFSQKNQKSCSVFNYEEEEEETYDNLPHTLKSIASSQNTLNRDIQTITTPSMVSTATGESSSSSTNFIKCPVRRLNSPLSRSSPLVAHTARLKQHMKSIRTYESINLDELCCAAKIVPPYDELFKASSSMTSQYHRSQGGQAKCSSEGCGGGFTSSENSFTKNSFLSVCSPNESHHKQQHRYLPNHEEYFNTSEESVKRNSAFSLVRNLGGAAAGQNSSCTEFRKQSGEDFLCDKEVESYFDCLATLPMVDESSSFHSQPHPFMSNTNSNTMWEMCCSEGFVLSQRYTSSRRQRFGGGGINTSVSQTELMIRQIRHGESYC